MPYCPSFGPYTPVGKTRTGIYVNIFIGTLLDKESISVFAKHNCQKLDEYTK